MKLFARSNAAASPSQLVGTGFRRASRFLAAVFISSFALLPLAFSPAYAQSPSASNNNAEVAAIASRLSPDIAALTRFPSRVPGTASYAQAANYVEKRMRDIGLQNVAVDEYEVTAPVTKSGRATLNIGGRELSVFPIYPNGVAPSSLPKAGLNAPMIYAGQGRAVDFNGKTVTGAIVVLDFNSGMNWITAADLGARAIVFLDPTATSSTQSSQNGAPTSRGEAERKFATVSAEMPRFYAPRATATAILSALGTLSKPSANAIFYRSKLTEQQSRNLEILNRNNATSRTRSVPVLLKSTVMWQRVKARNILGRVEGTDPELKRQVIVVNAYFDSMAITPDLAPGAEAAGNLAAFLEVARIFKAKPAKYTLLFVANGAHHLALAGTRNFLAKHFVDMNGDANETRKAEIASYRAFIGLDLTSRSDTLGLFAKGSFYNQLISAGGNSESILLNQFTPFAKKVYEQYVQPEAKRRGQSVEEFYVDGVRNLNGRSWRSYFPSQIALDSEAAIRTGKQSISFATANDARNLQDTPFDLAPAMNLSNLARQIKTVEFLMDKTLNSGATAKQNDFQDLATRATKLSVVFGPAVSRAIYRDLRASNSFLPDTPVPNAIGYILDRSRDAKSFSGVRGAFIEKAEYSKGKPRIAQLMFLAPRVGDSLGGSIPEIEVEAYGLSDDGKVTYAPDQGSEKGQFNPKFSKVNAAFTWKNQKAGEYNVDSSVLCFPTRSVALYDTLDQRYFTVLTQTTVLDGQTDSVPVQYGFVSPLAPPNEGTIEPIAIVYGKPGTVGKDDAGKPKEIPGARLKIIMAQGLLGKRLLMINTKPLAGKIGSEGIGVQIPMSNDAASPVVTHLSYAVARDLWQLDQQRIHTLTRFGISNQRVDNLHGAVGCKPAEKGEMLENEYSCPDALDGKPNGGAIMAAETALKAQKYDTFYTESRRAFGLESRAYPDVEATAQDVLKGILFYLALLLPFSYFVERILFGFSDIRKQIIGTSVAFMIVFFVISRVHPAFELAMTPFIILLAFIILALTIVVTSFLSSKFQAEMQRMKQGVHFADVGRLSALSAAVGLGVANMRRRPTRTALTCVTLILLTFTVLSFTSVTAGITNFARVYGQNPSYQGMMVRQPDWSPLQESAVTSMRNEFSQKFGPVALRAWYLSRDPAEILQMRVSNVQSPNQFFYAPALLGMTPEEKTIGSPIVKTLTQGRWFETGDKDVCLLPISMLQASSSAKADGATGSTIPLGLTPANALNRQINVAGRVFTVIGIYDDTKLSGANALRDLDEEAYTPVDYQDQQNQKQSSTTSASQSKGQAPQVQSYRHMDATALLIVPYDTAITMGATTRSVAASFAASATAATAATSSTRSAAGSGDEALQSLMGRAALGIFGAMPDTNGKLVSKLYSSVDSASYEGFAALIVPIAIAALIIANTMLGSVFERTKEIGIYSSIGLAPIHVAALFIAEAVVYAVLGSIAGYLIAQVVAKIVTATNLLPGITLNYSSSSAIIATIIVMATVLLSTLYPAIQASRLSQPDVDRKWQISEPEGDLWRFQFPFTVSGQQPLGVAKFLEEFFEEHTDTSVGGFYTDKVLFTSVPFHEARAILDAPLEENEYTKANVNANKAVENGVVNATLAGDGTLQTGVPEDISTTVSPDLAISRLAMRVWLAPFDMGVSQDVDIFLMPSREAGLYELQLRLVRRSGETSAWKRVNRGYIGDLRRQLLLWRTITPEGQRDYIRQGRAQIEGVKVGVTPADNTTFVATPATV